MAYTSVTYTFTNATVADATQVNQNFTDLINGLSDGTKDISCNALTAAGAATLNGNVTLGNASGDDITFTGSLAATLPIKTTNTYDIGAATKGLAGIYLGANSQTVRLIGSASMSATWTLTLPTTAGTANYPLITNGSGVTSWSAWSISAWAATTSALGTVYLPNGQIKCNGGVSGGLLVARGGSASGDTCIRNFTTANVVATGTAITRTAQTTTAADKFTINEAGVYGISYTDRCSSGTDAFGVSINTSQTSTAVGSIASAESLGYYDQWAATCNSTFAATIRCAVNDIIRAHLGGVGTTYVSTSNFLIITQLFRTA